MTEPSLFADLPFPDDLPEFPLPEDGSFTLEDFDLDDLDIDFDLDLFPADVQPPSSSPPPPPLATSSSSAGSPDGGSSSSGAPGGDGSPKNDEFSESSWRSASAGTDGKPRDGDGADDESKRRARLVRNRESAHLSRQRKKQYVEELEGKVKAMQATIADLSVRISSVTAENAALKQQLGGAGAPPPLPMYPGLYPLPPSWIHPAYAMRGSQVLLVPIPRLKTRQPAPTEVEPRAKKAKKTKKVASVSLLGLLCLVMLCGCLVPAVNRMYGAVDSGKGIVIDSPHRGRVVAVEGPRNSVSDGIDSKLPQNASETLPALLYLPRSGKHVKINGNLVIKSIVASEKALSHYDGKSSGNQGKEETGLTIHGHVTPLNPREDAREVIESAKGIKNKLMALPGDGSMCRDDDEFLPQWFSEAMSGPMLSSGMCTEVFQFDLSPTPAGANGIVPVYPSAMPNSPHNLTEDLPSGPAHNVKNRRTLHPVAIPLPGSTSNHTEHLKAHPKNESFAGSNKTVSSVVVSILADPKEDSEGRISSKSLSRIFVVVLIDSVKYVTYSCVLPFKSHSPHL